MGFEGVFKSLGEATRIRIIKLLAERDMYVCELECVLNISQPRISQHLKILKHEGVVSDNRDGQKILYSLNKDYINNTFQQFIDFLNCSINNTPGYEVEATTLKSISDDPRVSCCVPKKSCK